MNSCPTLVADEIAHLSSRVQLAVSVFLVRGDYVFLSQRRHSEFMYPGHWKNMIHNVTGNESALAVAQQKTSAAIRIRLPRNRFQLQGQFDYFSAPKLPCRLLVFCATLYPGEMPLCKESTQPPWMPFPIDEVASLQPMMPTLRRSLDFLSTQGGISP